MSAQLNCFYKQTHTLHTFRI